MNNVKKFHLNGDKIKEIFINNKERYGYRRITLELRNQGYNVNHKKVYRIMVKLGLKPLKRNKRKYSSYKGTVGEADIDKKEKVVVGRRSPVRKGMLSLD